MGTKAYCVKCRETVDMEQEEDFEMRNGKQALKGKCSECGTTLFKIKPAPKGNLW